MPSGLRFFQNHSSQMAALDYMLSLESDELRHLRMLLVVSCNMAKVAEGHRSRRYLLPSSSIPLVMLNCIMILFTRYRSLSLGINIKKKTITSSHKRKKERKETPSTCPMPCCMIAMFSTILIGVAGFSQIPTFRILKLCDSTQIFEIRSILL